MLRSIRVRLTLLYVALLAVILAIFAVGVYFALHEALYSNLDDSLDNRVAIVQSIVSADGELDPTHFDLPGDPVEHEEYTRVYDTGTNLVFDNGSGGPVGEDPGAVEAALAGHATSRREQAGSVHLVVHTEPLRTDAGVVGAVEVGLSDDDARDTLRAFLLILVGAYVVAVLVAAGGGLLLATRALAPVDRLTTVARRITAEDLSQRLDLHLPDDELGRLARTFDEMIARLDEAFRRQRQFTADASHELRTPLTVIKGQTEVALQRERTPEDYQQVLRAVNAEVDRMIRLISSLLTLARADSRQIPIARERVALRAIITDAVEEIRPAAEVKGHTLTIEGGPDVTITADQDLLLQLLLTLLDNAIKYTSPGGAITVSWSADGQHADVRVSDTGPGITAEHLPHIFDRFYRADTARSRAEGGAGLGLSIARWIAEAHGGIIRAESTPGQGATFVLHLPLP